MLVHHTAKSGLAALVVAAGVVVATMSPAAAGYMVKFNKDKVQIRASAHTSATLRGWGYKSHSSVCMLYVTTGDTVGGSNVWGYIEDWSIGVDGFAPASRLNYIIYATGAYAGCGPV